MLEKDYINFNHGSYGATPRVVHEAKFKYSEKCELKPDVWFRNLKTGYKSTLDQVRSELGSYLCVEQAQISGLVLVDGASSAVNAVLRSLLRNSTSEDVVVYFHTAYHMVKSVLKYLQEMTGVTIVQVNVTLPLTSQEAYLVPFKEALEKYNSRIKIVIFSHISSIPAIIEPIVKLAALSKAVSPQTAVLVDGAHALGQITVNITELSIAGVDFWVGNGHKWLYSPKGAAVLWVSESFRDWRSQHGIVPNVISSLGSFSEEFSYTGTKDYTSFLAVHDALSFREKVGGDAAIIQYLKETAWNAGRILSAAFGNTLTMAPQDMVAGMVDVQLPLWATSESLANLTTNLLALHNAYLVVYEYISPNGTHFGWWCRISAQIYLDLSSFNLLAQWVLHLLKSPLDSQTEKVVVK